MTKTITLVSCVKSKTATPRPARDLYASTLFQSASAYAQWVADQWFILSALHGLVEPDHFIAP